MSLSLNPNPTFCAKVEVPLPGAAPEKVQFTFRHRTADDLKKFVAESADAEGVDTIMAMATGWDLEEAFTRENVALFAQNYIGAARAAFEVYLFELARVRLGN